MKFLVSVLLAVTLPAQAAELTARFYGYAYDLESNRYLYTEVHEQKIVDDRWVSGSIRYYGPDAQELGRKSLDFTDDPFIPVYRLELPYSGYVEGITSSQGPVEMIKQAGAGKKPERASIEKKQPMAADSGFHNLLRANFADLMDGRTVAFHFAVAGSLDSFRFRARRIQDTQFEGKPAARLYVEANSLLRLVAPSLELTYDPQQRKLLEYRGISNIHDPATGKAYNARIAYYSAPPADVPRLPPLD